MATDLPVFTPEQYAVVLLNSAATGLALEAAWKAIVQARINEVRAYGDDVGDLPVALLSVRPPALARKSLELVSAAAWTALERHVGPGPDVDEPTLEPIEPRLLGLFHGRVRAMRALEAQLPYHVREDGTRGDTRGVLDLLAGAGARVAADA